MKPIVVLALVFLFATSGCGPSSYITSSWKAENVQPKSYRKIVVLGLIGDSDSTIREKMEEHLAGDLRDLGYDAVTSTNEYGPGEFQNMKEETEVLKELCNKKIDAVVTIVLLNKTKESHYTTQRVRHSPYPGYPNNGYPNRFWGYYTRMHNRVYSPGYYEINTKYFWETNFYDLNNGDFLYSAQSHSFDPGSSNKLGHEYGLMIVKDMVKKKVLQQQTTPLMRAF